MTNWLFSKSNIVACGAASIGLMLFLIGVIDKFWWLISIGLYFLTFFLIKEEKPVNITLNQVDFFSQSEKNLQALFAENATSLPNEAQEQLSMLIQNVKDLNFFLSKNKTFLMPTQELYSVQGVFEKYVPAIITKYATLPAKYANTVVIKDGKTTKDLMMEQLQLLNHHFESLTHSIYESDANNLVVSGRLLREKFQPTDLDLLFSEEKELNA